MFPENEKTGNELLKDSLKSPENEVFLKNRKKNVKDRDRILNLLPEDKKMGVKLKIHSLWLTRQGEKTTFAPWKIWGGILYGWTRQYGSGNGINYVRW